MLYFFLLGNSDGEAGIVASKGDQYLSSKIYIFRRGFFFLVFFFFQSILYYHWPIMHEYQLLLSIVITLAKYGEGKVVFISIHYEYPRLDLEL